MSSLYLQPHQVPKFLANCCDNRTVLNKLEKNKEKFNRKLIDLFAHMSQPSPEKKVTIKGKDLTKLLATLKDCNVFSNGHMVSLGGCGIMNFLENACKGNNEPLARKLLKAGVPLALSAIKAAIENGLERTLEEMYPRITDEKKIEIFPALCQKQEQYPTYRTFIENIFIALKSKLGERELSSIFSFNEAAILDFIDLGFPLDFSSQNKTLTHVAVEKGFPVLATRLVQEKKAAPLFTGNPSPLSLLGKSPNVRGWFDVFFALQQEDKYQANEIDENFFHEMICRLGSALEGKKEEEKLQGEEVLLKIMKEVLPRITLNQEKFLNYQDEERDYTLLMEAAEKRFEKIGQFLCEKGVDCLATAYISNNNILHLAIYNDLKELLQVVLKRLPHMSKEEQEELLEQKNEKSLTPLLLALKEGKEEFFKQLIEVHANEKVKDIDGWGCPLYALLGNLVELLEGQLKESRWRLSLEELNCPEEGTGNTVGIAAAIAKQWKAVIWFIQNEGDAVHRNLSEETLFHFVAEKGDFSVVEEILALLEKDLALKEFILNTKDINGDTPLARARKSNTSDVIELIEGRASKRGKKE